MGWLQTHEFVAIWLEGIALVLIFFWDRLDSRSQHKEMLAQLRATERQIEALEKNALAAKTTAESVVNAERAWIMGELSWWENSRLRISQLSSTIQSQTVERTAVALKLTCKNEGKSPAWIDNVYGHLESFSTASELGAPNRVDGRNFGPMGPLGAGRERSQSLDLTCPAKMKDEDYLAVYVVIEYRDIFGVKRETFLGHALDAHGNIGRQDALPERNRNT
jgi:hypothetical protein